MDQVGATGASGFNNLHLERLLTGDGYWARDKQVLAQP